MNKEIIKTGLKNAKMIFGKSVFQVKKFSPEILLVTGTAAIGVGIVLACKETLNVEDIVDATDTAKEIAKVNDDKKELTKAYLKGAGAMIKNYAPAATCIGAGFMCIYGSYGILNKRNVALSAGYNALSKAYDSYRDRVKEAIGEEKENDIYHGITKGKISETETGEDGKAKTTKKNVDVLPNDPGKISPYAKFFDEYSKAYRKDPEYNYAFLKAQQSYANDLLQSQGHLFLNEVYDMLGIPRTKEGSVVGWILGRGDDFVDFGLYNGDRERVRAFINGYEPSILLDFNVDGLIFDKI